MTEHLSNISNLTLVLRCDFLLKSLFLSVRNGLCSSVLVIEFRTYGDSVLVL